MSYEDKKILVMGAGRSGVAAASFLASRGAIVTLNDQKPLHQWSPPAQELKDRGVGVLAGCESPGWLLDQIEMIVVSPGIPQSKIPIRYAERAGAEVIGEFELASRHVRGRIVAITGTNGKTTTTALTGKILSDAGLFTLVGGNIGVPFISLVDLSRDDGWTVVEASSFQLETIKRFHPQVAIVLNVTSDHLDRYTTLNEYAETKHRIFMNQEAHDVAILSADDEILVSWAKNLSAHVVLFSVMRELQEGLFLRAGREIVSRSNGVEKVLLMREEIQLRGLHNVCNVMAGAAAGLACGAAPASIRESVKNFTPVEHRLEHVATIDEISFYNDSKATNVDAAIKALEAFVEDAGQIVLLIGGRGKGTPYTPLIPLLKLKARSAIAYGEDADRITSDLKDATSIIRAGDLNEATRLAFSVAMPGDAVLLAPACASFDMFEDYEERGRTFKKAVATLSAKRMICVD